MSVHNEARAIANRRASQTGQAVYVYEYTDGRGFSLIDEARHPLDPTKYNVAELELVEIVGRVPPIARDDATRTTSQNTPRGSRRWDGLDQRDKHAEIDRVVETIKSEFADVEAIIVLIRSYREACDAVQPAWDHFVRTEAKTGARGAAFAHYKATNERIREARSALIMLALGGRSEVPR